MALLFDKVALITGASRGVGYAAAKKWSDKFPGASIYLTTKTQAITPQLNDSLRQDFGHDKCEYIHLDVNDKANVAEVADMIKTRHCSLDVLINNAGVYSKPVTDTELFGKQAEEIITTNYFGLKNMIAEMRPILTRGGGARVVNMSSHLGHLSHINGNERAALDLREELADINISEERLDSLMVNFMEEAKAGTWHSAGWPSCAYTVSKVGVNVYTRVLQRIFSTECDKMIVNSIFPGTEHSKIHQTAVVSMEKGAFAVANCACVPDSGPKGAILWHNLIPVKWEDAVGRPSIIGDRKEESM